MPHEEVYHITLTKPREVFSHDLTHVWLLTQVQFTAFTRFRYVEVKVNPVSNKKLSAVFIQKFAISPSTSFVWIIKCAMARDFTFMATSDT